MQEETETISAILCMGMEKAFCDERWKSTDEVTKGDNKQSWKEEKVLEVWISVVSSKINLWGKCWYLVSNWERKTLLKPHYESHYKYDMPKDRTQLQSKFEC